MALSVASRLFLKRGIQHNLDHSKNCAHYLLSVRLSKSKTCCFNRSLMRSTDVPKEKKTDVGKSLGGLEFEKSRKQRQARMKFDQRVKNVILLGIAVTVVGMLGTLFYYMVRQLFSGASTMGIYSTAFKRCAKDPKVIKALGEPLREYKEDTQKGPRTLVSQSTFEHEGMTHLTMTFYIQGPDKKAEVNLEAVKNDSGKYDYRYLCVRIDDQTIILEDNR